MRPFRHPTAPKRQAPMGRGCRPAVDFYIEVLIRVPGDESVRQWASLRRYLPAARLPGLKRVGNPALASVP